MLTVALRKQEYLLINYLGYKRANNEYELYDLANDTDATRDLYPVQPAMLADLRAELEARLGEANRV